VFTVHPHSATTPANRRNDPRTSCEPSMPRRRAGDWPDATSRRRTAGGRTTAVSSHANRCFRAVYEVDGVHMPPAVWCGGAGCCTSPLYRSRPTPSSTQPTLVLAARRDQMGVMSAVTMAVRSEGIHRSARPRDVAYGPRTPLRPPRTGNRAACLYHFRLLMTTSSEMPLQSARYDMRPVPRRSQACCRPVQSMG
jgi:hypothetical protein